MKCPICGNKLEEDEILFDVCDQGHSAKDVILYLKKENRQLKKDTENWKHKYNRLKEFDAGRPRKKPRKKAIEKI